MKDFKCYSTLISLPTFEDRFNYLVLRGAVGRETFGYDRYLNQILYQGPRWKKVRDAVIVRDDGCDLAFPGLYVMHRIQVHHMNPITLKDIEEESESIYDPEFLITVSFSTHNAIHYGAINASLPGPLVERKPGDTTLWLPKSK